MIINPIIPVWLMAIICVVLLLLKRKGIVPYIRQVMTIVLLFVINLRIMIPDDTVTYKNVEMNMHVIFVVDNTLSMVAQDYNGKEERLTGVKEDCNYIIDKLGGAKFSVISFDNVAHILSPFSNDQQFASNSIASIRPLGTLYAKGSALNLWHDAALEQLKLAKEQESGDVVLFFISDGENNTADALGSFKDLAVYIDNGAVLGYGTAEGGIMQIDQYGNGNIETVEEPEEFGKAAVSKINEKNLQKIADDMGVSYINMNKKDGLDRIIDDVLKNAKTSESDKKTTGHKDIYFIFVIPFLLLVIYEFIDFKRKK